MSDSDQKETVSWYMRILRTLQGDGFSFHLLIQTYVRARGLV